MRANSARWRTDSVRLTLTLSVVNDTQKLENNSYNIICNQIKTKSSNLLKGRQFRRRRSKKKANKTNVFFLSKNNGIRKKYTHQKKTMLATYRHIVEELRITLYKHAADLYVHMFLWVLALILHYIVENSSWMRNIRRYLICFAAGCIRSSYI